MALVAKSLAPARIEIRDVHLEVDASFLKQGQERLLLASKMGIDPRRDRATDVETSVAKRLDTCGETRSISDVSLAIASMLSVAMPLASAAAYSAPMEVPATPLILRKSKRKSALISSSAAA